LAERTSWLHKELNGWSASFPVTSCLRILLGGRLDFKMDLPIVPSCWVHMVLHQYQSHAMSIQSHSTTKEFSYAQQVGSLARWAPDSDWNWKREGTSCHEWSRTYTVRSVLWWSEVMQSLDHYRVWAHLWTFFVVHTGVSRWPPTLSFLCLWRTKYKSVYWTFNRHLQMVGQLAIFSHTGVNRRYLRPELQQCQSLILDYIGSEVDSIPRSS